MGKTGGGNPYSEDLAQIAKDMYRQTNILRTNPPVGGTVTPSPVMFASTQGSSMSDVGPNPYMRMIRQGEYGDWVENPQYQMWERTMTPQTLNPMTGPQYPGRSVGQPGTGTIDILSQVLAGERPSTLPIFTPATETINAQYGRARESTLAGGTRGGQLQEQLYNLSRDRAQSLGNLDAQIANQMFTQALGTAFGAPNTAIQGYGQAGQLEAASEQAQAQEKAGLYGGLGAFAGLLAGQGGFGVGGQRRT